MLLVFLSALAGAIILTGLVRRYALNRSVLDVPNARSSHTVPTPRGGGLSIILVLPLVIGAGWWWGWFEIRVVLGLSVGVLLLSVVGFVDDHRPLSARLRFSLQGLSAFFGLLLLPGLPSLPMGNWQLSPFIVLPLLWLALVWLTNLYNFMDGIDGLATLEAISVLAGGALLLALAGVDQWQFLVLLCAPMIGFLCWNFPPAKIFMGDVCSAPLGLLLGMLGIWLAAETDLNLWCWLILLSVFIVDATWTLIARMLSGQRWAEAHRSHAYQILSRRWGSHRTVTLGVVLVNIVWLWPWAALAYFHPAWALLCWLLAAIPLAAVCYRVGAGHINH